MKKTILALAVSGLFATTAQAAVMYDADGIQIQVYGDLEVQYLNDTSKEDVPADGVYDDAFMNIDDADFGFKLGHTVNDDVVVGGVLEISAESGDAELGDAFIGIQSKKYGELTFGKHATILDDAGIGADFAFGLQSAFEQNETGGFQVLKYKFENDTIYGGVAYLMNTTANGADDVSAVDAKIGARVAGFDFTVFYGTYDDGVNDDAQVYLLEARYQLDALSLEATVGQADDGSAVDSDTLTYGVAATFAANEALTFSGGVVNSDPDAGDDVLSYYVNSSYGVTDYCLVYVELGGNDADDTELGYVAGMQVSF